MLSIQPFAVIYKNVSLSGLRTDQAKWFYWIFFSYANFVHKSSVFKDFLGSMPAWRSVCRKQDGFNYTLYSQDLASNTTLYTKCLVILIFSFLSSLLEKFVVFCFFFHLLKTEKLPFGKAGKMWISNYDIRLDSRDGYCPFDSLCGLLTVFGNSGWGVSLLQPTF